MTTADNIAFQKNRKSLYRGFLRIFARLLSFFPASGLYSPFGIYFHAFCIPKPKSLINYRTMKQNVDKILGVETVEPEQNREQVTDR